jgi:hypothetical protein
LQRKKSQRRRLSTIAALTINARIYKRHHREAIRRPQVVRTLRHWDVQNEYHVQNLLWVLFAPVFPDLEDEEYLRSLGHKHPRCDLAIPSLRVIIEVKFVYNGEQADFANVIEGVAADTSLYLSERTGFSQIVAFVWDNSKCSEQHNELLQGLRRINGIKDAVVVSRPGGWT